MSIQFRLHVHYLPIVSCAFVLLTTGAAFPAAAEEGPSRQVLAVVNGTEITADQRPGQAGPELARDYAAMSTTQQSQLLVSLINRQLVLEEARKLGFDQSPQVQARLQAMADSFIAEQYLLTVAAGFDLGEEAVAERYRERYAQAPEQFLASHIVLSSEEEARQALRELAAGADFSALARERSLDAVSASRGGSLGWVGVRELAPNLAEALLTLKEGGVAPGPVKTVSGWHVLRLDDRRDGEVPSLDAMRNAIRQELAAEQMAAYLERLREQASIEIR